LSEVSTLAFAGVAFFEAGAVFVGALAAAGLFAVPFFAGVALAAAAALVGALVGAFFATGLVLVVAPDFLGDDAATFFAAVTSTSFKVRPIVGSGPHGLGGQTIPRHQMGG
jgi:hypothetical protein